MDLGFTGWVLGTVGVKALFTSEGELKSFCGTSTNHTVRGMAMWFESQVNGQLDASGRTSRVIKPSKSPAPLIVDREELGISSKSKVPNGCHDDSTWTRQVYGLERGHDDDDLRKAWLSCRIPYPCDERQATWHVFVMSNGDKYKTSVGRGTWGYDRRERKSWFSIKASKKSSKKFGRVRVCTTSTSTATMWENEAPVAVIPTLQAMPAGDVEVSDGFVHCSTIRIRVGIVDWKTMKTSKSRNENSDVKCQLKDTETYEWTYGQPAPKGLQAWMDKFSF